MTHEKRDQNPTGSKQRKSPFDEKIKFISPYLSKDDKSWLDSNVGGAIDIIEAFLDDLPAGYTLSSKFDDFSGKWLATLICSRDSDPNRGYALTARGRTRVLSLFVLGYLHVEKSGGAWISGMDDGTDW